MSNQYRSNLDYLRNYRSVAGKVKEIVVRIDPNAKVYVFGSVVRGRYTAFSDIDILVVTEKISLKYDMMVAVYKELLDARYNYKLRLLKPTRDGTRGLYNQAR